MKKIPQDIIGDIAILKFPRGTFYLSKKIKAWRFLRMHKNVKTVLEKVEKVSGRLRKQKTRFLAGVKTKQTLYRENDCSFLVDVDETYFSPRLSHERKRTAEEVLEIVRKKREPKILVMFAGVAPYPIVIGKFLKQNKINARVYSNELNRKANELAGKNIRLNKLEKYVFLLEGDAKKISQKTKEKFDVILMPRPNLKETFLNSAEKLAKKGAMIFYHGFGEKEEVLDEIAKDIKIARSKIKIRKAGDIAPRKFRWLARFKV